MVENETNSEAEFDFGFDNFRPMGFTFDGVVVEARIRKPEKETYSFENPNKPGQMIVKEAKPQLVLLVQPTDHKTKTGNPYPEYFPLTHNTRSKLGLFVESLRNLGITLGNDPSVLEGREFRFEIKEVDFGAPKLTRVMCPVGVVDALSRSESAAVTSDSEPASAFDSMDADTLSAIAAALDGVRKEDGLVAAGGVSRDARVIAGMVSGELPAYLEKFGLLSTEGDTYVAIPTTAE